MATTITPNMNLPVPVVGQETGPEWATDINNCMSSIDSHDHSAGRGVPITPDGLNISSDLPYNSNNLTLVRSVRFSPNPSIGVSDLDALYCEGVDLYYVDGNGNQVRITQSGSVAGTPGSIANLVSPASASYVSANSKFVWQSDTNTSADMDFGSAILRNDTANSKGLTLQPPAAMASDYSITLPTLPGSSSLVTMNGSGVMSTATQITNAQLPALNYAVSSSCGNFSHNGGFTDVTNLSVTITTAGRPVFVGLIDDGTGNGSNFGASTTTGSTGAVTLEASLQILNGSTVILETTSGGSQYSASGISLSTLFPVAGVATVDYNAGTGSNTYTVKLSSGGTNAFVNNAVLIAYELP
jgi:hypothetical protein